MSLSKHCYHVYSNTAFVSYLASYITCLYLQAGFNVKPNEDTPLSELLQLSLEKHLDELSLISSQASKEYALEKVGQS